MRTPDLDGKPVAVGPSGRRLFDSTATSSRPTQVPRVTSNANDRCARRPSQDQPIRGAAATPVFRRNTAGDVLGQGVLCVSSMKSKA